MSKWNIVEVVTPKHGWRAAINVTATILYDYTTRRTIFTAILSAQALSNRIHNALLIPGVHDEVFDG
jgi:hypothetical protein